jgi:hypothetical protein
VIVRIRRGFRWFALVTGAALGLPLLASTATTAGAAPPGGLPPGLQPSVVNVTDNPTFIYGEPEIAVNPKNPNNLVYVATALEDTPNCQVNTANPNHNLCQNTLTSFGPQPTGLVEDVPGFSPNAIYTSFDGGKTWKDIPVPVFTSPFAGAGFLYGGDPGITATPDGAFYLSEDVINFQATGFILKDGGVAVSKSTDGGRTWSTPVLTGTAGDRPFITSDASTGTVYEESGELTLGAGSTANPNAPNMGLPGRYLVASTDGEHWATPVCTPDSTSPDGTSCTGFLGTGIGGPFISAANGVFATGGGITGATCGTQPKCELFQTTTDAGLTWSQHVIPNSPDSSDGPLVAADPASPGHFSVGYLNAANTKLIVWQTHDYGNTWSGPTVLSNDPTFTKVLWKPWMAYSSDGTLGLMWRTWEGAAGSSPYSVSAAISSNGGATFSAPLEVSDGDSAAPANPVGLYVLPTFADDFSFITLNKDNVYVAWADWRQTDSQGFPERQGFLSTIKLQAFSHN